MIIEILILQKIKLEIKTVVKPVNENDTSVDREPHTGQSFD